MIEDNQLFDRKYIYRFFCLRQKISKHGYEKRSCFVKAPIIKLLKIKKKVRIQWIEIHLNTPILIFDTIF